MTDTTGDSQNRTSKRHTHSGLFKKGVSGNPGGKTKEHFAIQALARVHTVELLGVALALARSPKTPPAVRLGAVLAIWDRGWGRPAQTVTGDEGGPLQVIIRRYSDLIEHDPK